jgi:hypothetical protein
MPEPTSEPTGEQGGDSESAPSWAVGTAPENGVSPSSSEFINAFGSPVGAEYGSSYANFSFSAGFEFYMKLGSKIDLVTPSSIEIALGAGYSSSIMLNYVCQAFGKIEFTEGNKTDYTYGIVTETVTYAKNVTIGSYSTTPATSAMVAGLLPTGEITTNYGSKLEYIYGDVISVFGVAPIEWVSNNVQSTTKLHNSVLEFENNKQHYHSGFIQQGITHSSSHGSHQTFTSSYALTVNADLAPLILADQTAAIAQQNAAQDAQYQQQLAQYNTDLAEYNAIWSTVTSALVLASAPPPPKPPVAPVPVPVDQSAITGPANYSYQTGYTESTIGVKTVGVSGEYTVNCVGLHTINAVAGMTVKGVLQLGMPPTAAPAATPTTMPVLTANANAAVTTVAGV